MLLTPQEEAECLRYLGYANWNTVASSFQLGYPSPSQPEYLIRDAFTRINAEGLELVRRDLCALRSIECQMMETNRIKAEKIGDMTLNPHEFNDLRQRMAHWTSKLADDLGGYMNPFGSGGSLAGSRNAKVMC